MFLLYRIWVNALGDEHSATKVSRCHNFATAQSLAQAKSLHDNCRTETRWKVVRADDLAVLCSYGPYLNK